MFEFFSMVETAGFEPATPCVQARDAGYARSPSVSLSLALYGFLSCAGLISLAEFLPAR